MIIIDITVRNTHINIILTKCKFANTEVRYCGTESSWTPGLGTANTQVCLCITWDRTTHIVFHWQHNTQTHAHVQRNQGSSQDTRTSAPDIWHAHTRRQEGTLKLCSRSRGGHVAAGSITCNNTESTRSPMIRRDTWRLSKSNTGTPLTAWMIWPTFKPALAAGPSGSTI